MYLKYIYILITIILIINSSNSRNVTSERFIGIYFPKFSLMHKIIKYYFNWEVFINYVINIKLQYYTNNTII